MDEQIFSLRKLEWAKAGERRLSHLVCSNNVLVAAVSNRSGSSILRWNLEAQSQEDEIEISRKMEETIQATFIDPTGNHVIISMSNGDNFYLHSRSTRPKKISRLQGAIESVAFDKRNANESSTKSFLAGTSQGCVYEFVIDSSGKEKLCSLVFQLGGNEAGAPMAITSLHFDLIQRGGLGLKGMGMGAGAGGSAISAHAPDSPGKQSRLFVVLATTSPTRLYHFSGPSNFSQLFSKYKDQVPSFTEFPGETPRAELVLYNFNNQDSAQLFCLGTREGIYHGTLRFAESANNNNSSNSSNSNNGSGGGIGGGSGSSDEIVQAKLMPFLDKIFSDGPPFCIVPTEFHFLALGYDKMRGISRLNGSLVQEEVLRVMDGGPVGLVRDPVRNTLWYYSDSYVFQISTVNEDRHLWTIYLEKAESGDEAMFDVAYNHCRSVEDRAKILYTRAEFLLARGESEKAATYFARSGAAFEDVVLRLLSNVGLPANRGGGSSSHSSSLQRKAVAVGLLAAHLKTAKPLLFAAEGSSSSKLCLATTDGPELSSLRVYLQEKLRLLAASAKSQRTMICTWLCEIFLHQISTVRLLSKWDAKPEPALATGSTSKPFPTPPSILAEKERSKRDKSLDITETELINDFKDFLTEHHQGSLEKITTIELIASRAQESNRHILLFYAQLIGDYDSVVGHFAGEERHSEAISMLQEAPLEVVESLVYKYAPVLMEFQPELAVELFLSKGELKTAKLLPALLRYESLLDTSRKSSSDTAVGSTNWAVQYLQHVFAATKERMQQCDPTLCHTLGWLLAKYDGETEEQLCAFLQGLIDCRSDGLLPDTGSGSGGVYFQYLLTQCTRFGRRRALVYVYLLMESEEQAMGCALALTLAVPDSGGIQDLELAKTVARSALLDSKKKSLWLQVAVHVVREELHAKGALQLIEASEGFLSIEDLLPLLPEFTEIDLFKEEICLALEESESHIETLKAEMEELSESAEAINDELDSMKKRGFCISSMQRCEYCSGALFSRQFYLFPCCHGFHTDCQLRQARAHKHLAPAHMATVKGLEDQIRELSSQVNLGGGSMDVRSATQMEYLQNELDSYVAADCPLCGYVMIRSVAVPLISEEEAEEAASWALTRPLLLPSSRVHCPC